MFLDRLLFILFFLSVVKASGQGTPFLFHHLKEKDGLSNNIVNCFLKDSRGILWVGTFDGLNRFDGSHFYTFKRNKTSNSIINNAVQALCEDKQNNIWGATDNGIFCYNPNTNSFKNYLSPNSKLAPSATNVARAVYNILCDSKGNIWATGVWTVLRFNSSKDVFEDVGPLAPSSDSLRSYEVRKNGMIEDPSGNGLWLATRRGLHFYDFKTGKVSNFKNHRDTLFTGRGAAALHKTVSGKFWFFDNNLQQIFSFDPASRKITNRIDIAAAMPNAVGATLFEDKEHRLWFSSWSSEIAVVDLQKGNRITKVRNDLNDPLSIAGDFFWCATEDEDGTLWLGTLTGISRCNASKSMYRVHRIEEKLPLLKGNSIQLIVEDTADKSWWVVTRDKLFAIHYFPASEKHVVYDFQKAEKNTHGSLPAQVYSLSIINHKPVLGTHNGAWQIETEKNKIIPFPVSQSIDPNFTIRALVESNGTYFFTDGKEIMKYDLNTGKGILIKYPYEKLNDDQPFGIGLMILTTGQKAWFAMGVGWLGYINDKDQIIPVNIIKNKDEEMNGYFTSIDVDAKGRFWIANIGIGLYCVDPSTDSVKRWNESDGLMHNHIQRATVDKYGNVWCSAYNKFSIFTPQSGSFYNFSLPISENNLDYQGVLTLLSNGNILASIQNEIIEFYPGRLNFKPYLRKPFIGSVNIAGNEKLNTQHSLVLNPDEKSLSFKFGLLTDKETFPYSFEYKLEGLDDKWIVANPDNQAVYNKLPSGNYTFRLVAKAKNGSWQSPETTLRIHIKTPFFKSIWFYGLVVISVCSLLYFFYRFRTAKQKQLHELSGKAQMLEKEKTLVMYENLKQQLNPHFLFNSLTSLNSLIEAEPKAASEFLDSLSKTYRYILKSRDSETVSLIDEIKFAENYVKLQKTRFERGFEVNINVPEELYHRKIVPVTLQNLVENAIKHNVIDEDSPLVIDIYTENDYLIVQNNLQKKKFVETSNKQGLVSMESLYHYLSSHPLEILESEQFFTVKIPLL